MNSLKKNLVLLVSCVKNELLGILNFRWTMEMLLWIGVGLMVSPSVTQQWILSMSGCSGTTRDKKKHNINCQKREPSLHQEDFQKMIRASPWERNPQLSIHLQNMDHQDCRHSQIVNFLWSLVVQGVPQKERSEEGLDFLNQLIYIPQAEPALNCWGIQQLCWMAPSKF